VGGLPPYRTSAQLHVGDEDYDALWNRTSFLDVDSIEVGA
jgi:hypothetical protein